MAGQNRAEPQADRAQARRKLEAARKREGILEAAGRAFARGGYHVTTMQDIAREAGYTPPSLYAYFDSKEEIFLELAALLSQAFLAVFDEPMPARLTFHERVELLLHRLFEKVDRYRDAVSVFVMARLSGEPMIAQGMTPASDHGDNFSTFEAFVSWLRKNAKRGDLGEHRPEEMGIALAGLTHAFCIQWLAKGSGAPIAPTVTSAVSLFLYGVTGSAPRVARTSRSRQG